MYENVDLDRVLAHAEWMEQVMTPTIKPFHPSAGVMTVEEAFPFSTWFWEECQDRTQFKGTGSKLRVMALLMFHAAVTWERKHAKSLSPWLSVKKSGPPPLDSVCWVKGDLRPCAAVYRVREHTSTGPGWRCHGQEHFSPANVTHYIILPKR